ncbi:hypothetical protein GUJ93_ZPchr0002g26151 [Zizania palustris]|uniref:Uncharacterized protein n=1 Tax=Zizania palustris TaxID=103762 RepID=A0A8J5RTD2_ZIZPA|nr:hypothetical protein GUJ93_ZPchr0002g26151 [Zizania palustris]
MASSRHRVLIKVGRKIRRHHFPHSGGAKEKIRCHHCATAVATKADTTIVATGEPPMLKERAVKEQSERGCACPVAGVEAAMSVGGAPGEAATA